METGRWKAGMREKAIWRERRSRLKGGEVKMQRQEGQRTLQQYVSSHMDMLASMQYNVTHKKTKIKKLAVVLYARKCHLQKVRE